MPAKAARRSRSSGRRSTATTTAARTAGGHRLSDLLALIHDTPGIERIKFVTNYPKDMTDDLLDAVRGLAKVCPYLHVPAQSGCDDVLKRMKRLYTVEFYRDMLARCREVVPGVAVSSDFIVGFSGETEESFQKTCDLVATADFKNSYIFKYSTRPGTKGHDLFADDIPEDVKRRRNADLLTIQNTVSLAGPSDAGRPARPHPGRRAEQRTASRKPGPAADPADRANDERSHRRLRRQSASGGPHRRCRHSRGDHAHALR